MVRERKLRFSTVHPCPRELTKCIDSVLETGGFKVKGWLSNKANSNTDQEERKEAAILQGVNEEKVLGVVWNNHTDIITLKVKPELLLSQEPGCSNLRSNWLCICISYQSQDRPTGAVGKGRRLGREITLRNSRKMDQPVSRNEEPQWHKLREMSDTALCSWPPCTLCFF